MPEYGLTIENQNLITQKAKDKKDGCYQFRGVAYRVRKGRVTHLAHAGNVVQPFGHFNVQLGKLDHCSSDYALKFLKTVKDDQNA